LKQKNETYFTGSHWFKLFSARNRRKRQNSTRKHKPLQTAKVQAMAEFACAKSRRLLAMDKSLEWLVHSVR
jgi:hypothetical protein